MEELIRIGVADYPESFWVGERALHPVVGGRGDLTKPFFKLTGMPVYSDLILRSTKIMLKKRMLGLLIESFYRVFEDVMPHSAPNRQVAE